jgi:hypothetical protein
VWINTHSQKEMRVTQIDVWRGKEGYSGEKKNGNKIIYVLNKILNQYAGL